MEQTIRCAVHPHQVAFVYCATCDTHQTACHACAIKSGKHFGHAFISFDEGLQTVTEHQKQLLDQLQLQQQDAKDYLSQQCELDKRLVNSVLQSVSELDKSIDKLVNDLQEVRLALHTAALRAAQTARYKAKSTVSLDELAKAVRHSTKWMTEMRKTLDSASLSSLSDLVDRTPWMREQSVDLAKGLHLESVDFDKIAVDTSFTLEFKDKLSKLNNLTSNLRRLSDQLVVRKPTVLIFAGGLDNSMTYAYDATTNAWRQVAPLCQERSATAATLWNGKVVIAGGWNSTNKYLTSVEQYDPETNSWTALPDMLHGRNSLALVCFKDTLFAIGGYNGTETLDCVEKYDAGAEHWEHVGSLNSRRRHFGAAVSQLGVLVAGGYDKIKVLDKCELFDNSTQTWKYVASLVTARRETSAATLNEKVYVFGGWHGNQLLDSVEEYDSAADKWNLLAVRLSIPRTSLATSTVKGLVYICGGRNSNGVCSVVESFDVSEMRVSCVESLPKAVCYAAAAEVLVSDKVYMQVFLESPGLD